MAISLAHERHFGSLCFNGMHSFWERFDRARRHVGQIDRHETFENPAVVKVLEKSDPDHVVFEFTFNGMAQWEEKIAAQKRAMQACLWPRASISREEKRWSLHREHR